MIRIGKYNSEIHQIVFISDRWQLYSGKFLINHFDMFWNFIRF